MRRSAAVSGFTRRNSALSAAGMPSKLAFAIIGQNQLCAPARLVNDEAKTSFRTRSGCRIAKAEFLRVNPDTAALRRMHDRDLERMRAFTDLPDDQVRGVKASTLVICGDHDIARPG